MEILKAALAIDEHTKEELKERGLYGLLSSCEKENSVRPVKMDGDYFVYYWDDVYVDDGEWNRMMKFLEHRRHSLVEVKEDGSAFIDVEEEDEFGSDEVFRFILGTRTDICLWQEPEEVVV